MKLKCGFRGRLVMMCALCLVASWSASAQETFSQCLVRLQDQAQQQQLPAWIVQDVVPFLEKQERVVELDRNQPEFVQTFGQYLAARLTPSRIERGRQLYLQHRSFLDQLTRQYGVPGQYLVAFWGLETNFGSYLGTMPTLDSLATLACDPRRSDFFTEEFLNALHLMDREQLQVDQMRGSWAGAVGHTQFMPSSYLKYAVDGDGDGRINLWSSEQDALASGANFLASLGWVAGQRWGREVQLPMQFDYFSVGLNRPRSVGEWASLGLQTAFGSDLPEADFEAAVLVPSGAGGPAFLVYDNFEVIMRWNRSESYALSVGLLANRIAGAAGLVVQPSNEPGVRYEDIARLQQVLADMNYNPGPVDGIWGPATRQALAALQRDRGLVADGYPTPELVEALIRPGSTP